MNNVRSASQKRTSSTWYMYMYEYHFLFNAGGHKLDNFAIYLVE